MKRVLLITLALVLILLCISFTACGKKGVSISGPGGDIQITNPAGNGNITIQPGGKTPENFGDIPIYPGSSQLLKVSGEEDIDGQPGILDHRMYSTSDSVEKAVNFYKAQMPVNGWTEDTWVEAGVITMGTYNKAEKQGTAVIGVMSADTQGGTSITIDKKYLK